MKRTGLVLLAFGLMLVNALADDQSGLGLHPLALRGPASASASAGRPRQAPAPAVRILGAARGQWALFTDEAYGFSIRYPIGWRVTTPLTNDGKGPGIIELRRLFQGPEEAGVNIDLFPNPEGLGLEQWFDRYQARYLVPEEPVQKDLRIAGQPAIYSVESYRGPLPQRHTVLLAHGGLVYRIEYQANDGGKSLAIYRRMLRSLAFAGGMPSGDRLFDTPQADPVEAPVGSEAQDCCGYHDPYYNPYGCYDGNCVWWGRYKRPDTGGQGYPYWGYAQYWTSRAAEEGFTVDGIPVAGALAGTPRSGYIRPGWEHHVAFVESFDGDRVSFSDMDYGDYDCVIDRWSQPAWNGIEFIHVQEDVCPQSGGVILYWNDDYDCQNEDGDAGYRQRTAPGWVDLSGAIDDQSSSLRVESGWSVRLYEASSRGGASVCRNGNDGDLAGDLFDGGVVGLDDQISSYEVFDNNDCDAGPQQPATLYQNVDYGGDWCALAEEGWANVCSGFNDVASSIRVQPGWSCRVYKHIDRDGTSLCLTGDTASFSAETFEDGSPLNDQISSFEAFHNTTCTPPCSQPSPPSLDSPQDGAALYPEDGLVLDWSGDADEYRVHLSGGPGDDYTSQWVASTSLYTGTLTESPDAYEWHVQGRNGAECEGPWSATWEFRMGPRASSLLTATAASCTQIDLSWRDDSTTESDYHIERSTDGSNWSETVAISGTLYVDTGLRAETAYHYRLRAHRHSDDTYSGYSTADATTQGGLAPAPSLVLPANGAGQCDITPTFDWSAVSGAEAYRIQVDEDDGFGSPEIDATTSDSEYVPGAALPGDTYYWRVLASNSCGEGAWSQTWTYLLLTMPEAPGLWSPADGSQRCDTTPAFDWSASNGATVYRIQVSDDSSFVAPVIKVTTAFSDYTSRTVLAPGTYYWRVRAGNICGQGAWSTASSFDLGGTCGFAYLPTLLR